MNRLVEIEKCIEDCPHIKWWECTGFWFCTKKNKLIEGDLPFPDWCPLDEAKK